MPTTDYFRYILALLFVLGLIAGLGQLAKKYNWAQMGIKLASRNNRRLRIVEIQAIDTRHKILLAQRDDMEYVLAVSPERITLLDKIPVRVTMPATAADAAPQDHSLQDNSLQDTSMGHPS